MRPREAYVRATVEHGDTEMIVGLEMRSSGEFLDIKDAAKAVMSRALDEERETMRDYGEPDGPLWAGDLAARIEQGIVERWPDRYWFLEVCVGERDGWVQIFAAPDRPAIPREAT